MRRRTFDQLLSATGLVLVAVLGVAGSLLTWAHHFVSNEVHTQLAAQQIYFPAKGSPAIAAPEFKAMNKYAGQAPATADHAADHVPDPDLLAEGHAESAAAGARAGAR